LHLPLFMGRIVPSMRRCDPDLDQVGGALREMRKKQDLTQSPQSTQRPKNT
jgi:hypothetical protein